MTAARLRTAAAKLREVAEGATPGPWFTNAYSGVFAPDRGHGAWQEQKFAEGHSLESRPCAACPGGVICQFKREDYLRDPHVAGVPALFGDTPVGNHDKDVQVIATMHPGVALAMADLLEATAMEWHKIGKQNIPLPRKALAVADAVLGAEVAV